MINDYEPVLLSDAAALIAVGDGTLSGWTLTESTGTASATITVYDGTGPDSAQITQATIPAGTVLSGGLSHDGVHFRQGLYLDVAGSLTGAVYYALTRLQP